MIAVVSLMACLVGDAGPRVAANDDGLPDPVSGDGSAVESCESLHVLATVPHDVDQVHSLAADSSSLVVGGNISTFGLPFTSSGLGAAEFIEHRVYVSPDSALALFGDTVAMANTSGVLTLAERGTDGLGFVAALDSVGAGLRQANSVALDSHGAMWATDDYTGAVTIFDGQEATALPVSHVLWGVDDVHLLGADTALLAGDHYGLPHWSLVDRWTGEELGRALFETVEYGSERTRAAVTGEAIWLASDAGDVGRHTLMRYPVGGIDSAMEIVIELPDHQPVSIDAFGESIVTVGREGQVRAWNADAEVLDTLDLGAHVWTSTARPDGLVVVATVDDFVLVGCQ